MCEKTTREYLCPECGDKCLVRGHGVASCSNWEAHDLKYSFIFPTAHWPAAFIREVPVPFRPRTKREISCGSSDHNACDYGVYYARKDIVRLLREGAKEQKRYPTLSASLCDLADEIEKLP